VLRNKLFQTLAILGAGIGLTGTALAADSSLTEDNYRHPEVSVVKVNPLQLIDGVVLLSNAGCQLVEPEGQFLDIDVTFPRDCPRINRKSKKTRVPTIQTLTLKPGTYKFRVSNTNVPFPSGLDIFKLKKNGKKEKKPTFSKGEILAGYDEVFEIELKEGKYVYTGRQNLTFDYPLVVSSGGASNADADARTNSASAETSPASTDLN